MTTKLQFYCLLSLLLFVFSAKDFYQPKFYYSYDEKLHLNESSNKIIVRYVHDKKSNFDRISLKSKLSGENFEWKDDSTCVITTSADKKSQFLEIIQNQSDVKTCNPLYTIDTGLELGVTDEFVVCFKEDVSLDAIKELNAKYNVKVFRDKEYDVILQVPKGADALEIANKYQETGLTVYSYPNFISYGTYYQVTPNDQYFVNQYSLHNTGQIFTDGHSGTPDADIDAPEAWNVTTGCNNIIIAIIDQGVTANHFDLPNTRQVRLNGSNIGGADPNNPEPIGDNNHGNACAGIASSTMIIIKVLQVLLLNVE